MDAYVHQTEGEPGYSPGQGGNQRVSILLELPITSGQFGSLPALIYRGALAVGGKKLALVPLPFQSSESSELTLTLADDAREVRITGSAISVQTAGEFRFIEHVDFSR
jgi:hypothetical protein